MSQEKQRRVAITGIGVVSPFGGSVDQFWKGLTEGASDPNFPQTQGVADFRGKIEDFGSPPPKIARTIRKSLKLMNRETQLGAAAGQKALDESGVLAAYDPERMGVAFGADNVSIKPEDFQSAVAACTDDDGEFRLDEWGDRGIEEIAPLWLLKCLPNMPACHLAIINDLRGPINTITQRDLAANLAIAEACRTIKDDCADAIVVGATGTLLPVFNRLHAELEDELSNCETPICRPFDKKRIGPAPGEGAAAFVLEDLHKARARGAKIYGEILGYGAASLVGHDGAFACRQSLERTIKQTLHRAHRNAGAIGHVHAHGLGTKLSDSSEAQAIQATLGSDVPVVAAKSHLAHAGTGAGALEIVASLIALEKGHLFPVRNLTELDPECPIRPVTSTEEPAGESFLNLSLFGRGLASCVAVGRLD